MQGGYAKIPPTAEQSPRSARPTWHSFTPSRMVLRFLLVLAGLVTISVTALYFHSFLLSEPTQSHPATVSLHPLMSHMKGADPPLDYSERLSLKEALEIAVSTGAKSQSSSLFRNTLPYGLDNTVLLIPYNKAFAPIVSNLICSFDRLYATGKISQDIRMPFLFWPLDNAAYEWSISKKLWPL